jgi:phosphoribosylglycinamide formyltransferase-1
VCLAGFMRIISPEFVKKYKNRMINIHPALLPAFPGLDSQKQALDHGAKYSGCTVHFVDTEMDTGPIIIQAVIKVKENDTEDTLAKRILKEEHRIYPEAVNLFARKKIKVSGRRTIIS